MSTVEMMKNHIEMLNINLRKSHSDDFTASILSALSAAHDTLVNAEAEQNRLKHLKLYEEQQKKKNQSTVSVPIRHRGLGEYSTKELHEELVKRSGVEEVVIDIEGSVMITNSKGVGSFYVNGPARVLINKD